MPRAKTKRGLLSRARDFYHRFDRTTIKHVGRGGVVSGRTSSGGAFKGYRIYKTADGGWTVPELDSSVFEDKTQAKRFISEWTKRRGNKMKRRNARGTGTSSYVAYPYSGSPKSFGYLKSARVWAQARANESGKSTIIYKQPGPGTYHVSPKRTNPRAWRTITASNVGKYFEGFGYVLARDVGKKYYIQDGSYFVENNEQMARRLGKSSNPRGRMVKIMGHAVRVGTKRHAILLAQKKHADDLQKHEVLVPAKVQQTRNGYKVLLTPRAAKVLANPLRQFMVTIPSVRIYEQGKMPAELKQMTLGPVAKTVAEAKRKALAEYNQELKRWGQSLKKLPKGSLVQEYSR